MTTTLRIQVARDKLTGASYHYAREIDGPTTRYTCDCLPESVVTWHATMKAAREIAQFAGTFSIVGNDAVAPMVSGPVAPPVTAIRQRAPKPAKRGYMTIGGGALRPDEGLLSFLIRRGGIKPTGETRAMDATIARPGLVRKSGMDADTAREACDEAGFFAGAACDNLSTVADFYAILDSALRGGKPLGHFQPDAISLDGAEADDDQQSGAREEIRMVADDFGLDLAPDEIDRAAALLRTTAQLPIQAIVAACREIAP